MKRKLNSKIVKEHKKQKNIYNLHTDGFEIINYNLGLYLYNNQIKEIPKEIGQLQNLQYFDLID